jgi:hypothetical protein
MNESAYYLGEVLEQLIRYVLYLKKELKGKRKADDLKEGIISGYYAVIGKLFDAAASLGVFEALPKDLQEHITPLTLVEDLKKGDLTRIIRLRDAFRNTSDEVAYGDLNLRALFEEIITEGLLLKKNVQSEFDEGKTDGYSFCLLTLYNQVWVFVPELFDALPKKLRTFVPESLSGTRKQ